jgi:hypothetical protein
MASGIGGIPADWARSMTDPQEFRREQDRLSRVWTFPGADQRHREGRRLVSFLARDPLGIRAAIRRRDQGF